jgi:signal transduction histidine kinase
MTRWTGAIRRPDALLAGAFGIAAAVEATVRYHADAGLLGLGLGGAVAMVVLLVRRRHPLAAMTAFCVSGVGATIVQAQISDGGDDAFVPIIALVVLSYSLGASADPAALAAGAPQPVFLVSSVDLLQPGGEDIAGAVVFVSAFVVALPVVVGRLVRSRRRLTAELHRLEADAAREHEQQLRAARAEESLAVSDLLGQTLAAGLERLLDAEDIEVVEGQARALLAETRDVVVGLSREPSPPALRRSDPVVAIPQRADDSPGDSSGQTWSVLVAAAVGTGLLVETGESWGSVPAGLALTAVLVAALASLARRPLVGTVVAWAAATVMSRTVVDLDGTFSGIGVVVATPFLVCWLATRRAAVAAVCVGLVGALVGIPMSDRVGAVTMTALAVAGGVILRDRTTLLADVRAARAEAAVRRREELRVAVLEQRAALGRELHDSVGHALTVVALQAGAARRLRDTDPVAAAGARDAIERTARQALLDLRRGFESLPGGIDGLLDTVRTAGVDVTLTGPPPPRDLAAVVHRVLQEALTNALRHAPGAAVVVHLRDDGDAYACTVRNRLTPGGSTYPSGGRGLPGMRARVEAIGGTVEWTADEEGFTVTARFPTRVGASQ